MPERTIWEGKHSLEFYIYQSGVNWFWGARGSGSHKGGPLPNARTAFLDAVFSHYWPNGTSDWPETSPAPEREIKVTTSNGRWYWCEIDTNGEYLRRDGPFNSRKEALLAALNKSRV